MADNIPVPQNASTNNETTATNANQSTAPVPNLPLKDKIKVNGKELELDYNEIKRLASMGGAANQKFEEAAKQRKEAEAIKAAFSEKNVNSLLKAGWTKEELVKFAEDYLVEQITERSMSPEQLAQREKERELEELKRWREEKNKEEEDRKAKEIEAKQAVEAAKFQQTFIKDVKQINEKTWLDLERPEILAQVINQIVIANKNHGYDLSVEDAVKNIEKQYSSNTKPKKEYLRQMLKASNLGIDDADLDAFLDKGVSGIRERSVAAIKNAEAPLVKSKAPQAQSTQTKKEEPKRDALFYRKFKRRQIDWDGNPLK